MSKAFIELSVENGIGTISLNRPERKNAFNFAMWGELDAVLDTLNGNLEVRVVILESAVEGVFSAGADLEEFKRVADDPDWREKNRVALGTALNKIMTLSKPSIALIDGAAFGAGCGLALAADIRLCSKAARFCIPPAKLGLVYPLQETKRLVDLVGPARAKQIIYTADVYGPEMATIMGLVNHVVEGNLKKAGLLMATKIANNSQHSIIESKKMIRRVLDGGRVDSEETIAAFLDAYDGDDFAEGAKAFLEKRKPDFK
jgi:enoyl-CoA hydratase/carnithine racemase